MPLSDAQSKPDNDPHDKAGRSGTTIYDTIIILFGRQDVNGRFAGVAA